MLTKKYWQAVAERMVRAGAAATLALYGVEATNLINGADALAGLQAFGSGALLALLLSLAAEKLGSGPGPSFTAAEVVVPSAGKHRLDPPMGGPR